MRVLCFALPLLAIVATAKADDARLVPAAGAKLTYRLIATTTTNAGKTSVSGQIYTYSFTSSDGVVAEATIRLDAMLFDCQGRDDEPFCARILKAPGARADGHLVLVPVPDNLSENLAKATDFKVRYFIVEKRVSSLPAVSGADDALFIAEDPLVTTNVMDCDEEALSSLPPKGDAQHATLSCRTSFARSGWAALGRMPATSTDATKLDVVDFGMSPIALPSGTWDTRRLKLNLVSKSGAQNMEGETRFSEKLGVAVKTRWTFAPPSGDSMTEFDSELIAATP
jgi:hypothetical protein